MSVIIGDQTGLVKVVSVGTLAPRKLKNGKSVHANTSTSKIAAKFGVQERGHGVARLCWAGVKHREEQFALLRDNGIVEVWSPGEKVDEAVLSFAHPFEMPPAKPDPVPVTARIIKTGKRKTRVIQPTKLEKLIAKVKVAPILPHMIGLDTIFAEKRRIVSASEDGVVCVSQLGTGEEKVPQHSFKVGADMWAFDLGYEQKRCAVGGKEQLLKTWDLETSQCAWKARNVPNDWLDLQVPEWIKAIKHRPQNPSHIFTATAHHKLRMYDVNAGRRCVLDFTPSQHALVSLAITPNPNYVIVGDATGSMMLLDVRNGQQLGVYRGSGGALRDIVHHPDPSMPVVASVGLDRFLKIHHSITRRLIKRIYLKQKMNCILFSAEAPSEDQDEEADVWAELERRGKGQNAEATNAVPVQNNATEGEVEGDQDDEGDDDEGDYEGDEEDDGAAEDFFKHSTSTISFAGAGGTGSAVSSTKRKR